MDGLALTGCTCRILSQHGNSTVNSVLTMVTVAVFYVNRFGLDSLLRTFLRMRYKPRADFLHLFPFRYDTNELVNSKLSRKPFLQHYVSREYACGIIISFVVYYSWIWIGPTFPSSGSVLMTLMMTSG